MVEQLLFDLRRDDVPNKVLLVTEKLRNRVSSLRTRMDRENTLLSNHASKVASRWERGWGYWYKGHVVARSEILGLAGPIRFLDEVIENGVCSDQRKHITDLASAIQSLRIEGPKLPVDLLIFTDDEIQVRRPAT